MITDGVETIDKRISKIESHYREGSIPDTSLTRVYNTYPKLGVQWCFGFGYLQSPKQFFYGESVDSVITQVEQWLGKGVMHRQSV